MGRRKQDCAGFLRKKFKDKLNAPPQGEPFAWLTQELMESGAFRALTINGRRVLDRLMIEHMRHGGQENGRLKVTWNDFVKFGIGRRFINHAINEVTCVGLVAIEIRGGKHFRNGEPGDPTHYRLTWLAASHPNEFQPATNEWKRYGDDVEAARKALPPKEVKGNGRDKTYSRRAAHLVHPW